ncbi:MAG: hypothetical protein EBV76_10225 [Gammaproteobacteria bacterium]|nr:hypothetical protein [Gammaproteobacteria bacterium]
MTSSEIYLLALLIIFSVPYLLWRLGRTDHYAPLVVVQIVTGIVLGPGLVGDWFPRYYEFVFNPQVVQMLNAVALWAVMLFVFLAGIELDLRNAWRERRDSAAMLVVLLDLQHAELDERVSHVPRHDDRLIVLRWHRSHRPTLGG